MLIRTKELTVIEKRNPEYCVVITDTVDGWKKQVGLRSRCEQSCNEHADWIRSLFSKRTLKRYIVSVEQI